MTSAQDTSRPSRTTDNSVLRVTATLRAHQREWWSDLQERVLHGRDGFVLAGASVPHEIFEAMDIPYVTDVWYSSIVAAKRQSRHYSDVLGRHGYHDGLDRYSGLALGVVLDEDDPPRKPWGGLPRPALVVTMGGAGSSEAIARHHGVPHINLERPTVARPSVAWWEQSHHAWEDLEETYRIDALAAQYESLITACERIFERTLDRERLRSIIDVVNAQERCFEDVRAVLQTAPKLPVRLAEVMSQVMGIQWHRGTEWALRQAEAFRDEVQERAREQQWVCPNETYRLMYVGRGLWQQLEFLSEFEKSHGVVFARSNYLSIACDAYPRYGVREPVRNLAARYATFNDYLHYPPWAGAWAVWEARTHRLDGAVQLDDGDHGVKFIRRALETEGFPVLDLPTDPVDSRAWDGDRMREMMVEFIETRLSKEK
ncbi:2-hydroxyacyl-CoA dehydratase family protein [Pseudonocardia sp. DLS-67]